MSAVTLWAGPTGQAISTGSAIELRVFAPPGALPLAVTPWKRDITGVGLRLGQNWHLLENYTGEGYRWMATGGSEIVLGNPGMATDLVLEIGAGSGYKRASFELFALNTNVVAFGDIRPAFDINDTAFTTQQFFRNHRVSPLRNQSASHDANGPGSHEAPG